MDSRFRQDFPRAARYLESLPSGAASHPDCTVTVEFLAQALGDKPLTGVKTRELPPEMARLAEARLPVSAWVPEVPAKALVLVAGDLYRMDDEAFLAWYRALNERMLGGRFFRILVALATPGLLMAGARHRWNGIHHGSTLGVVRERAGGGFEIDLDYPSRLYDELLLKGLATSFEAALALSNAREPKVTVASFGQTRATFAATWG